MTLAQVSTVPVWLTCFVLIVFAAASILLLSGHGSFLIAEYNMTKEKEKIDSHRLSKKAGYGIGAITLFLLLCFMFQSVLPIETAYVFVLFVFVDFLVMAVKAGKN